MCVKQTPLVLDIHEGLVPTKAKQRSLLLGLLTNRLPDLGLTFCLSITLRLGITQSSSVYLLWKPGLDAGGCEKCVRIPCADSTCALVTNLKVPDTEWELCPRW